MNEEEEDNINFCLYKYIIDETLTSNNQLEHKLILTDINLNTNKMAIEIDSNNKYIAYIEGTRNIVINKFKKSNVYQLKK